MSKTDVEIPEVFCLDMLFGADVGKCLPAWETLPEEYRILPEQGSEPPGYKIAEELLYTDRKFPSAKSSIDGNRARRIIVLCMRSLDFSPSEKIARVGYMLSQWFDLEGDES